MNWTKARAGKWLLLSLVPTFLVFIVAAMSYEVARGVSEDEVGSGSIVGAISLLWLFGAAVSGTVLRTWGAFESRVKYNLAQACAKVNG